ncbi:MAG: tetratricopeptide repeat protein [bacterium]
MQIKIWWPLVFVTAVILACILIFPSDLRLADLLSKSGKVDEAIAADRALLAQEPLRDDVRLHLSQLFILKGELARAVAEIEAIGIEQISEPALLNQMADIYSQLGDRGKTVKTLERLVVLLPHNPAYREKLAEAYQWNHQTEKAIGLFKELLTDRPHDTTLMQKVVGLSLTSRDFAAAKGFLDKLLELQPENARAHEQLGNVYLQLDQPEFAAVEYERVLQISPGNEAIRQKLAEVYLSQHNYERGLPHYERLFFDHVLNEAYFDRLVELTQDTYPEKAVDYFKLKLHYEPQDSTLRHTLCQLYLAQGLTDEAAAELQVLIKDHPEQPRYLEELAYLYKDMLEPDLAAETFAKLLQTPPYEEAAMQELRTAYIERQEYPKLLDLYAKRLEDHRLPVENRKEYATLLVHARRFEQAMQQYEAVLAETPRDPESRIHLATLYLATGATDRALHLIRQGVEKYSPDDPPFLEFAAGVLEQQEQLRESISVYERLVALSATKLPYQKLLLPLYLRTHNLQAARDLCEQLLRVEPDNVALKFQYASLFWQERDYENMHRLIDEINSAQGEETPVARQTAQFYFQRGFHTQAVPYLQQVLRATPADSLSLRMLALARAWSNQPELAKKAFRAYHEHYPNDAYTRYQLGIVLAEAGRRPAAEKEFQHALAVLRTQPPAKESAIMQAGLLAYLGHHDEAIHVYDSLLTSHPRDDALRLEVAHGLFVLKDYDESLARLDEILNKAPLSFDALRLRARILVAQGDYPGALKAFRHLSVLNPDDMFLSLDLAETELLTGDWVSGTRRLRQIVDSQPAYWPAQARLIELRREQSEAVAAEYQSEQQSGNLLKQAASFVLSKAHSSLLTLQLFLSQQRYSAKDNQYGEETYLDLGAGVSSSGAKLRAQAAGNVRLHDGKWRIAGQSNLLWQFDARNSVGLSVALNRRWDDPLLPAFFDGRVSSVQSDVNLALLKNILLWNRLSFERHAVGEKTHFSDATRVHAQVGYQWPSRPSLFTYYQFYHLNFNYRTGAGRDIIAIPERESIHYLGAVLTQQLTPRLYYELGGSLGVDVSQNTTLYYGRVLLEYHLLKHLRLRSLFAFGSLNSFTGREDARTLSVDFYYFY